MTSLKHLAQILVLLCSPALLGSNNHPQTARFYDLNGDKIGDQVILDEVIHPSGARDYVLKVRFGSEAQTAFEEQKIFSIQESLPLNLNYYAPDYISIYTSTWTQYVEEMLIHYNKRDKHWYLVHGMTTTNYQEHNKPNTGNPAADNYDEQICEISLEREKRSVLFTEALTDLHGMIGRYTSEAPQTYCRNLPWATSPTQFDQVHAYYKKIIKMDPNVSPENFKYYVSYFPINAERVKRYNEIALFAQRAQGFEGSIYLLQQILKNFPKRYETWLNLGDVYWKIGKTKEARSAYQKYLELKALPSIKKERINDQEMIENRVMDRLRE
jgi:tetratricopeptide (TPR) repeat protein